jgi:hypothetical protein
MGLMKEDFVLGGWYEIFSVGDFRNRVGRAKRSQKLKDGGESGRQRREARNK